MSTPHAPDARRLLDTLKAVTAARWSKVEYGPSYARQTESIIRRHGNPRLSDVTAAWIEGVIDDLALRCKSTATANRKLNCLQTVLTAAGITHTIQRLPVRAPERSNLSPEQLAQVDDWFKAYASWEQRYVYEFLRDTGCRPGEELRRFNVGHDVVWGESEIVLRSKKGARGGEVPRIVPATNTLLNALSYFHPVSPGYHYHTFQTAWDKMREATGISYSPYCLRHTYCYRLLRAGIPIHVVARMMGHSTVDTTMQYVHVNAADRTSVREALTGCIRDDKH